MDRDLLEVPLCNRILNYRSFEIKSSQVKSKFYYSLVYKVYSKRVI